MLKKNLLFIFGGFLILLSVIFISSKIESSFAYVNDSDVFEFYPVQNNEKLNLVDDVYQLDAIEKLFIRYKINSYDKNKYYFLIIYKDDEIFTNYNINFKYSSTEDIVVGINTDNEITSFKAVLYSSLEEFEYVYDSDGIKFNNEDIVIEKEKEFKVRFNKFDVVNFDDTSLNVVEVRQAGKVIEPLYGEYNNYIYYDINTYQDYELVLKGENFVDDIEYNLFSIFYNYSDKVYLGRELNEGITITIGDSCIDDIYNKTCFTNFYGGSFGLKGFLLDKSINYKDIDGTYYNVVIKTYSGNEYFDSKIVYTNYDEVEINGFILGKYHNRENSLSVDIKGYNFNINDKYDIDVNIYKNKRLVYEKSVSDVGGEDLNNEYRVELDGFVSELSDNLEDAYNQYNILVKVNYMTNINYYYYLEERARLNASVFNLDGSRIAPNRGSGEKIGTVAGYLTGNDLFFTSNKVYTHVIGDGFIDDENYQYKVILCNKNYNEVFSYNEGCTKNVLEGEITGKLLNDKGIVIPINSDNNGDNDNNSYVVVIYRDGKVIQFNDYMFDFTDDAVLTFTSLKSNDKNLYMDMRDTLYGYTVIKDSPLNIFVRGFNYDVNKNYNILLNFCYSVETLDGKGQVCDDVKKYSFSGRELNNGTAVIEYTDDIDYGYSNYEFIIRDEDGASNSFIGLNFVDSDDFFLDNSKYEVDGFNYLIKGVIANTDINSFNDNFKFNSGEKIRILNSDIEVVDSDYIGTGMISSIVDEYDRTLLNLDVVVKGDVSGDGRISITDLVKMKQHLAKVKFLDGLYELSGRITEGEKIGITDLVKVCMSVANDEVLE